MYKFYVGVYNILTQCCHLRLGPKGLSCNDHIIIGTPGSVLDWILRFKAFDPKKLVVFVLDEADVMISQQGHQDQSIRIKK